MKLTLLSLIVGVAGGMVVYYVQRFMAHDDQQTATAKGAVMGIVAGVPFMVTGTVLGLTMIVWLVAASVFKESKAKNDVPTSEGAKSEFRANPAVTDIVRREVRKYAANGEGANTLLFPLLDEKYKTYGVLATDYPQRSQSALFVVVMARVIDDTVIIEEDTTERPLVDALVAKGIPRAKIILAYAGETTNVYAAHVPLPEYE